MREILVHVCDISWMSSDVCLESLLMTKVDMPDDVRRFILTSVPSVPFLEAVLLLRTNAAAGWSASTVAGRLYLPEPQVLEILQTLAAAGIAQPVEGDATSFQYQPKTPELADMLDQLARVYSINLVGVTDLIHSRIDKRAQQFADAFRWRKDS
jgi:hypothetical protein